ncbi:MAG: Piwi domain-containing protein [Halothece sp.]
MTSSNYISTILEVSLSSQPRVTCWQVNSTLSIQQGRKIASHFSGKNYTVKGVYYHGYFWVISHPSNTTHQTNWQEDFSAIAQKLRSEFGQLDLSLTEISIDVPPITVISQLARQILSPKAKQQPHTVFQESFYQIYRELDIIPEIIFPDKAGIALNWKTHIQPTETLKDYWIRNNKDQNTLLKLDVRNRFANHRIGIIDSVIGTCQTERDRLLSYDLIPSTRRLIENSDNEDLVVSVKDKNQENYSDYVIAGLELNINPNNCQLVGLNNYEQYRKQAKIELREWETLLDKGKQLAQKTLNDWGIKVSSNYVNSIDSDETLLCSKNFNIDKVKLEFGKQVTLSRNQIKSGLKKGGVFSRHKNFSQGKAINVAALNLCEEKAKYYVNKLGFALDEIGFKMKLVKPISLSVSGKMSEEDVAKIDRELESAIALNPDLFLTILPEGDKQLDDTSQGSYYHYISQQLLKQGIPSQMVTVENLNNSYIINNIVLGILAKLGNLPFVLKEPLKVADCFLGLDVARFRKSKGNGTQNACACVRVYGNKGEFIKYYLEQDRLEGEEISPKILRKFTPEKDLAKKTVLVFRDGRFRGEEIPFLKERGEAINTQFIFVEITKNRTTRLFNYQGNSLQIPDRYLLFRHSNTEATVITTQPPQKVGIASPIRITIRQEGVVPPFRDVLEATFKLCLLHHGSYQEPKLPVPIYASDRIGYKTLKGLYHTNPQGDCQWWL